MASSHTGDEHGVLGFSAGQLRQARGRRAPADVVYLFFTATTTHSATPTPTHTRPVHALQRRHPAIITEVLRRLGYLDQSDRSVHFSYEMVALSPRCCAELGLELSEEEAGGLGRQLAAILEHVSALEELDTDAVEPTTHVVSVPCPCVRSRWCLSRVSVGQESQ